MCGVISGSKRFIKKPTSQKGYPTHAAGFSRKALMRIGLVASGACARSVRHEILVIKWIREESSAVKAAGVDRLNDELILFSIGNRFRPRALFVAEATGT
jgi:hypothetical protein